jgi:Photoprotection regulator fluorescence recovery protein
MQAGQTSMNDLEHFREGIRWTAYEKKVARKAFDAALDRHLATITTEAKWMMGKVSRPSDLWKLEEYLSENRKAVDRLYQFKYSDLLRVFSILMRDGWLKEADLVGLSSGKIADIKRSAESLRMIFHD